MIPYLKRLFMDEGAFTGAARAVIMVLGLAVETGKMGLPESMEWMGLVAIAAAMFMRSSVTPPKKED